MKQIRSRLKPYLRWLVIGMALFFLTKAFKDRAAEIAAIRISSAGWVNLAIATGVTVLAHIWSGWVWSWVLRELHQPVDGFWSTRIYLKTNIAKYLPGNVWHFYGRIKAATEIGVSAGVATLSVVLESLLMASAALSIALISTQLIETLPLLYRCWQLIGLVGVSIAVHPGILNPLIQVASRLKAKAKGFVADDTSNFLIQRYPLLPLLGEIGFVSLRGVGFLFTWLALIQIYPSQILPLLGVFSAAWLLGFILPGLPGGIGIFEATAIALLKSSFSNDAIPQILAVIALYRLVSILAEAQGAALVWLYEKFCDRYYPNDRPF
ncbi:MAG TPA: UPF0104 family protein [Leptolyngbyaceae cyanobacterium]